MNRSLRTAFLYSWIGLGYGFVLGAIVGGILYKAGGLRSDLDVWRFAVTPWAVVGWGAGGIIGAIAGAVQAVIEAIKSQK